MIEQTIVARRYQIARTLGAGGMATVYLGRDLLLNRDVAIKALHPSVAAHPTGRARFEREAQAAAGFTHPNIVDIYDVGEENGTPYIVMEVVRGDTLAEVIRAEGPFHPDDVASLLEQVGAALDYAHERGYVHRDVKPQNILVDARGQAKVADFGIALGLADAHLTEVGTGLGTVGYISPEQASGLIATPASDIYSLGVVAFEMLTQQLPFAAETPVGVVMRHIHDLPSPPSTLLSTVPPAVDALVLRALAKDPTRRFHSAGGFAQAMTEWRDKSQDGWATGRTALAPVATSAVTPRPAAPPVTFTQPPEALSPLAVQPSTAAPTTRALEDGVGCATWAIGSAILVGLVALVVIGFQLSPRLAELAEAPATEAPTAAVARPTLAGTLPDANLKTPTPRPLPTANDPAAGVRAPDLVGLTETEAITAANGRGFRLALADPVFSERVERDRVAEQDPPADAALDQGTIIYAKLSAGSATIDLAALQLVGMAPDAARRLLVARGLAVATDEIASADVAAGFVAGFDPPTAATVGDTVTLHVSAGDRVQIPVALVGQPAALAAARLTALGLRVENETPVAAARVAALGLDLATDAIAPGDAVGVEGNGAAVGAWMPEGSVVTLLVYDGGGA